MNSNRRAMSKARRTLLAAGAALVWAPACARGAVPGPRLGLGPGDRWQMD
ncbi:MAG: hypothetical protein JNL30_19170 [Rubrivivax sp.]|nr:hypothetical protein [Rubrivivax sp.]